MLDIEVDEADSFTVCRPVGELDAYTVGQFRDVLGELAEKRNLLIDLSAVPFMDSAGLGALIGGIRPPREAGGDVAAARRRSDCLVFWCPRRRSRCLQSHSRERCSRR